MSVIDWIVITAGLVAIAWVNWYFFVAQASTAVVAQDRVDITVKGGYSPATIRAAVGKPIRLVFDRQESSSCSEEIVFPDFGVKRFLPQNQKTTVEITPPRAGTYEFMCGMGMLHGRVIAE